VSAYGRIGGDRTIDESNPTQTSVREPPRFFTRMKLYTSNRLEQLAHQLTTALDAPLSSPLAREVIVVQSRGMARWLSLQIAQISKICMNCEFPFPRAFIGRALRAFFPKMAPEEEFSVEVMTWKISRLLPASTPVQPSEPFFPCLPCPAAAAQLQRSSCSWTGSRFAGASHSQTKR
jgi:hypothetical protein